MQTYEAEHSALMQELSGDYIEIPADSEDLIDNFLKNFHFSADNLALFIEKIEISQGFYEKAGKTKKQNIKIFLSFSDF